MKVLLRSRVSKKFTDEAFLARASQVRFCSVKKKTSFFVRFIDRSTLFYKLKGDGLDFSETVGDLMLKSVQTVRFEK